jgi:hypothetical protein
MPALVLFSLPPNDSAADDCTKSGHGGPEVVEGLKQKLNRTAVPKTKRV